MTNGAPRLGGLSLAAERIKDLGHAKGGFLAAGLDGGVFLDRLLRALLIEIRSTSALEFVVQAHRVHDDPFRSHPGNKFPHADIRRRCSGTHARIITLLDLGRETPAV